MKSIFDKITKFRKKRAEKKALRKESLEESNLAEEALPEEFDVSTMQKTKIQKGMSSKMLVNRNIADLMNQLEETFSQRLLRMIDERGRSESEAYTKAYVDRRHFSKIRKDVNYVPNKKTVLAFTIALELSLDKAKDLLASAGFALSRSSKTDIIVAYFLQNKIYDMFIKIMMRLVDETHFTALVMLQSVVSLFIGYLHLEMELRLLDRKKL